MTSFSKSANNRDRKFLAKHLYGSRTAPVVPPIFQSATFFLDETSYEDIQAGGLQEMWYSRFANPTLSAAADEIRALEESEAAVMTSSGMGAIATTFLSFLSAGARIVASAQLYGDTYDLLARDLVAIGIEVEFVDANDNGAWATAVHRKKTDLVYAESISNPQLQMVDIPFVANLASAAGAKFVVDNTFASPYSLRPLALGADLVVHSATKFLNGHSDVIAGCVLGSWADVREVQRRIVTLGTCLDPHAAFLVWRGLQTFDVRLERQNRNALAIARHLEGHPVVKKVIYPELESYTNRDLALRLLAPGRAGGVVSLVVRGGDEAALRVMRAMTVCSEATSLGGVETLVSAPFNSSHFSLSPVERAAVGIDPGMLRLSVGTENIDRIVTDLDHALNELLTEEPDSRTS